MIAARPGALFEFGEKPPQDASGQLICIDPITRKQFVR